MEIFYFRVNGNGVFGYIKNIFPLYKRIKALKPDIIHAHYLLCGILAGLTFCKPIVVSLMGSDVNEANRNILIKFLHRFFWQALIVKSTQMKKYLNIDSAYVLPNGVSFDSFRELNSSKQKEILGWSEKRKHILFASHPLRKEKNFKLAEEAVTLITDIDVELHFLNEIPNSSMPVYYNAADVVLLTSKHEGSPNVIKEAMACNTPIVATDVGDIKEVIGNTQGCFICSFEPEDVANKLRIALNFVGKTDGRLKVEHLEEKKIALRLKEIYMDVKLLK